MRYRCLSCRFETNVRVHIKNHAAVLGHHGWIDRVAYLEDAKRRDWDFDDNSHGLAVAPLLYHVSGDWVVGDPSAVDPDLPAGKFRADSVNGDQSPLFNTPREAMAWAERQWS